MSRRTLLMSTLLAGSLIVSQYGATNAAYICGATQMRHFGIHDSSFRLARNWAKLLPHTSAHVGAVVVQSRSGRDSAGHQGGHVSRIVALHGACSATVADEKGTYERDICSRLIAYVDPSGNPVAATEPRKPRIASRGHPRVAAHDQVATSYYSGPGSSSFH